MGVSEKGVADEAQNHPVGRQGGSQMAMYQAPPPPKRQKLKSEGVVVEAPMSFTGAAKRSWKFTRLGHPAWKILTVPCALFAIAGWWALIAGWYLVWGIFLVPWRLLRRGSRKRKKAELQHRETMNALAAQQAQMDQMQQQGQQPVPPPAG